MTNNTSIFRQLNNGESFTISFVTTTSPFKDDATTSFKIHLDSSWIFSNEFDGDRGWLAEGQTPEQLADEMEEYLNNNLEYFKSLEIQDEE